jgi:hypothetical protein
MSTFSYSALAETTYIIISRSLKFSKIFEGPLFVSETLNGVLSE